MELRFDENCLKNFIEGNKPEAKRKEESQKCFYVDFYENGGKFILPQFCKDDQ